ncbi:MAG: sensor histidine kinase [Spirochaetota bacterium]
MICDDRDARTRSRLDPLAALETAPVGIVVLDRGFVVIHWNAVIARLTGVTADEAADRSLGEIFPEFLRPRYRARLEEAVRTGVPVVLHTGVNRGLMRMSNGELRLPHYRVTCRRTEADERGDHHLVLWVDDTTLLDESVDYLRTEISARRRAEEELEAAVRSRDILYRELQHRVKNSLALISSLVALTMNQSRDPATYHALEEIENRVATIAMVYTQLAAAPQYGELDLAPYLAQLVDALLSSLARPYCMTDPVIDLDSCLVPVDTAVSLGLIVNELITNSIKHAFPEGRTGRITLTLRASAQEVELVVGDDGVGTGEVSGEGLGLGLIEVLSQQIGGALERPDAPGTWYRIAFPRTDPPGIDQTTE